jgi:phosphate transport system protein
MEDMVEVFHSELNDLKKRVVKMGNLAQDMLGKSVRALKEQDVDLAKEVLDCKVQIAVMDEEIEQDALKLITLFAPMAKDMRQIATILKMITYIARIGRYGKDIAIITLEISDKPHVKELVSIPYMAKEVDSMITDALTAFEHEDVETIDGFTAREKTVDELRYSIFRECLTYMMEDSKTIKQCTRYIMVSRYLERCGDHAVKMAEKVYYMVTGEHIDLDPPGPVTDCKI